MTIEEYARQAVKDPLDQTWTGSAHVAEAYVELLEAAKLTLAHRLNEGGCVFCEGMVLATGSVRHLDWCPVPRLVKATEGRKRALA